MIEIRKAYPIDAYTLINIKDNVWKNEFYDILPNGIINDMNKNVEKRIEHLIDQINENNRVLVALVDDKIVGYVFYAKALNEDLDLAAEIRELYILPDYQRKNIGTSLFESVVDELKKLGYNSIVLNLPINSRSVLFFLKLGFIKKDVCIKLINGYKIRCDLMYYEFENTSREFTNEWNDIYVKAEENLYLLNNINREIAVISTDSGNMYIGLGIKRRVCPLEVAVANMHASSDKNISKIIILNKESKPVLPCGRCRDLLIGLGEEKALILFDYGSLKTITMKELNPYYKDEEKV